MSRPKKTSAKAFDRAFDAGEDVAQHLDLKSAKLRHPVRRINLDLPKDLLSRADAEAARIGVTRTALFKIWIAERLDRLATS